jgi:nucleoid-associated protein YgaU
MARFQKDAQEQADNSARYGAEPGGDPESHSEAPQRQAGETYVVQPGDSLSAISQRVYGDAKYWSTIYEHNKDKISDPDVIQPGQELVIP